MAILGSGKQEKKITEFAQLAKRTYSDINELSIKGAFRLGAKAAVEKSQFSMWEEIADQPPRVRRTFFDLLMAESRAHLINVLGKEKVDDFIEILKAENEKYLKE